MKINRDNIGGMRMGVGSHYRLVKSGFLNGRPDRYGHALDSRGQSGAEAGPITRGSNEAKNGKILRVISLASRSEFVMEILVEFLALTEHEVRSWFSERFHVLRWCLTSL